MQKVMRIGTITTHGGGHVSVYIKAEDRGPDGYLSFTGVIGPSRAGNAYGGAGQIDMEFAHRNPAHNDSRFKNFLTQATDFRFAPGWTESLWYDLLEYWHDWHMKPLSEVPQTVKDAIAAMPDTDKEPAWV